MQHKLSRILVVNKQEIQAYLGFMILMGINELPEIRDYWSTSIFGIALSQTESPATVSKKSFDIFTSQIMTTSPNEERKVIPGCRRLTQSLNY